MKPKHKYEYCIIIPGKNADNTCDWTKCEFLAFPWRIFGQQRKGSHADGMLSSAKKGATILKAIQGYIVQRNATDKDGFVWIVSEFAARPSAPCGFPFIIEGEKE
jgi:hypothetical protein